MSDPVLDEDEDATTGSGSTTPVSYRPNNDVGDLTKLEGRRRVQKLWLLNVAVGDDAGNGEERIPLVMYSMNASGDEAVLRRACIL